MHPSGRASSLMLVLQQASPLAAGPCTPPACPCVCAAGSAGPRREHAEAGPPARAPQRQGILAFVVNLPLDVVRLGLRLVAGVFNLGSSLATLLGQRLLPGPVYQMFAGGLHCNPAWSNMLWSRQGTLVSLLEQERLLLGPTRLPHVCRWAALPSCLTPLVHLLEQRLPVFTESAGGLSASQS